ncbi:hypothetical protein Acid7E03_42400 [Acidisoma sp. 7E03]
MSPGSEAIYFDYSTPESRDESARIAFVDRLADCDHILTQLASFSVTNESDLRARFGSKVVTIANFYFRGLFPDSCYIGDFGQRLDEPSSVNSVVILDAFLRGESETAAVNSFNRENYARLGLLDAWALSMAEMRRREANGAVQVPGAELMEAACLRYPAFLTMNHPSIVMLAEYLQKAFAYAGIPHQAINSAIYDDPLDLHDVTPIDDIIAETRNLPYRGTQRWRFNSLERRYIDRAELVQRFYATYREAPRNRLVVNSPTDLVERYRSDPKLRFLVDAAAPVVAAPVRVSGSEHQQRSMQRIENTLDAILSKSEEARVYIHKLHSFHQIADPKIEAIRSIVTEDALLRQESSAASELKILEAIRAVPNSILPRIPRLRRLWIAILVMTFLAAMAAEIVMRMAVGRI